MLSNSYNNDKYGANTTSIFVPVQYKPQIEQIIEWQNGEFICAIETAFSFYDSDDIDNYDVLLLTVQESAFKNVARHLFDTDTLLALLLASSNPVEDDGVYLQAACAKQQLGNIWFNRDWLLPVPLAIHHAATNICKEYEGMALTSVKPKADNTYVAWYIDTTAHPEEDWYIMCREFRFVDNKAVDIHE